MIAKCMQKHKNLDTIIVALESTSVYSVHIGNFLCTCETLMPYKPYVFWSTPRLHINYRKSYIGMEKTDAIDAFLIADFARGRRTKKLESCSAAS
ncbi:transposase [Pilosibacter sp. HC1M1C21]|uniref:IS110 family transposase n=1 Tax=Pilosibacter sp. HC1M1C21 TaxID=3378803 RepID=UPI00385BEA9F